MPNTCNECRFFGDGEMVGGRVVGKCHRYAPGRRDAADPREAWVHDDYWCGDFKSRVIVDRFPSMSLLDVFRLGRSR